MALLHSGWLEGRINCKSFQKITPETTLPEALVPALAGTSESMSAARRSGNQVPLSRREGPTKTGRGRRGRHLAPTPRAGFSTSATSRTRTNDATRANLDEEEHDLQPLATCLLTSEGCLLGRMSVGRARRQSRPRDRRCVIAVSQVQLGANCATAADERTIGPPAEGCL